MHGGGGGGEVMKKGGEELIGLQPTTLYSKLDG